MWNDWIRSASSRNDRDFYLTTVTNDRDQLDVNQGGQPEEWDGDKWCDACDG